MSLKKGQDLGPCPEPTCKLRVIYPGRGAAPKWCPLHGDRRNRGKKIKRAEARGDLPEPHRPSGHRATDHLRLAACLKASHSLQEAAQLAGLEGYTDEALEALKVRAEAEEGLVELDAGAIGRQIRIGVALLATDFLDRQRSGDLPAGQLGSTLKALVQGLDLLQGGTANAFQPIHIQVVGPEGVIYDIDQDVDAG